jgi:DNA gyrase subunit A
MDLTPIIKESFTQYSGAVLQSRALTDVRDCLKPSARQIFYCLYTDKFIHSKPFKKTLKGIGSAMRMYIHGDSSCEGVIMRAGQPFAMRYPLIEVEGSFGNLMESGNWAAPRYTSARLSELANYLFADIDKDTIKEWRDNYDDTEQYPAVLPTKGFYNIVNGSMGIGIGMSSSIPQFNLREVNEALIKLLWNYEIDFDEIYCAPDFATGALLLNESAVKESLKTGNGFACKLRSVVEYDNKERCFVVKEIPYSVYTNTICGELEKILEAEDNPGVDRFNDLTGATPLIKIYLTRNANPDRVLKYLYKNTSLQYHYSINMTMLENGRYPKVFGWKDLLLTHLDHEELVYRRGFEFDLTKIKARIHIIEGLLKAYDAIDEVVQTIKTSASSAAANEALRKLLGIDEIQAKAILDLKLSKLSKLDINKLCNEKNDLEKEKERIEAILSDITLLKKEIENGLREVAKKFGDERRTKIMNISSDEDEPVEVKALSVSLTNKNNLIVSETSSLYTQKRGGVGNKFKLEADEYVMTSATCQNIDTLLFFTVQGNVYSYVAGALPVGEKTAVESLFMIEQHETIRAMTALTKNCNEKYIIFITKNGMLKKSELSEYNMKRSKSGIKALTLDDCDEICSVIFTNEERIGITTEFGNFLMCETKDIRPIGRVAKGVKGIKLNDSDAVSSAKTIPSTVKEIVSVSGEGKIKRTSIDEFTVQGRATKGTKLQKLTDGDWLADFLPITSEKELTVIATSSQIKLNISDIGLLQKNTSGAQSIKKKDKDNIICLFA